MDRWRTRCNVFLTVGFLVLPFVAYHVLESNEEGLGIVGWVLSLLGVIFLIIVKTAVFGAIEYVKERRELHTRLSDPAACGYLTVPNARGLATGAFLLTGSLPFLGLSVLFAVLPYEGPGQHWFVGGFLAFSLLLHLVAYQRISDYFLTRCAWREACRRD